MADQLVGQRFGGYEILEEIGRGGMAVVYKARQISMNRIVAVKVLPRQFVHDQTFRARFEREVAIVATLEHRAIVPVHDYGEVDEMPYIVMRHMDSGSVEDLLRTGPLSPERVVKIVSQIADGLDYAHTKGVLHRDLKPSNILLDEAGDAYLTDFGIARLVGGSAITTSGVVGTPAYMSPEQAQGLKLDGRSDVYGLAVVTFEMLTGERPYESDTPYGIAVMHVTAAVPSALDVNPALSVAVDYVLRRGLAKNRVERYQTAAEFAEALDRAARATPAEVAASTAQTRPIDISETHKPLEEADEIHVSAPVRPQESIPRAPRPTPPSSARVNMSRSRTSRSRTFWLISLLIGVAAGCGLFALMAALLASMLGGEPPPPTATLTPTPGSAEVTVIPPLGPLHPAALALTATAQARPTTDPLDDLSENGWRIVFYAARDNEDAELYLLDLATGLERQLTDNEADDIYPAVSPDGTQVAFMSDRDGDFEIFVMPLSCAEAGNGAAACEDSARQITDNAIEDRTPSWTPDSAFILYASDVNFDGQYNIYRVAADGSDRVGLTDSATRDGHPSASPDGRYVVYNAWEPEDPETGMIRRLDLETGQIITLYDGEGNDWSPSYSPDGSRIAFHRRGNGRAALWVMEADGTVPRQVYDGPGYDWGSAWSPNGRLLTFTSDKTGEQAIYLIAPDGGDPRRITSDGGEYPSWVGP